MHTESPENPFPGMNPYLEAPDLWPAVHNRLIAVMDQALADTLPPEFITTIEERVYLSNRDSPLIPDMIVQPESIQPVSRGGTGTATASSALVADIPLRVTLLEDEVREPYLEVRRANREGPEEVVAVIEVLSPSNKARESQGRDAYTRKQSDLLQSNVHLLEIDLLRYGLYTVAVPYVAAQEMAPSDWWYTTSLHRAGSPTFEYWPTTLQDRLPRVLLPLTAGYDDVVIDVQACFSQVYAVGRYHRRINYGKGAMPPIAPEQAGWVDALLRSKGLRS